MEKGKKSHQTWHLILFFGIVLVAVVLGIVQKFSIDSTPEFSTCINKETCDLSGGTWNDCGSLCRDGEVCLDLCVDRCECVDNSECPFGFECLDNDDGKGVCLSL